ncbi:hypothetical protein AgCh_022590 [Apium graveolens]
MLFADDSYLYCKAESGEARRILELLATYEKASGQRINRGKSTDKVKTSILNWTEKKVSRPAKEMLIKTTNNSKITWMAWERMSKHKHAGGLGFKSLRDVNLAMLGKQCWRLITNLDSLVARVYKAKYYADTEFMEDKLGSSPNFIWRSVLEAKRVISTGASWRIATAMYCKYKGGTGARKRHLVLETRTVGELFSEEHIQAITGEKGAWNTTANNEFWKKLWTIKAPPKALNLVWRASSYCLPTKTMLQTKHVPVDNMCPVCNEGAETIFHGLVQCKTTALYWKIHNPNINTKSEIEFTEWLTTVLKEQSKQTSAKIITLCWDGAIYWAKPQHNAVKITVDAAIFEDQGASGLGAIVRNHDGHLILAKTRCFNEVMNPLLAEAIAVREALSWTKEMLWNNNIIESDCLIVVQMIRSATSMRSRLGKVIEECRVLIQELNNVTLYFIRRSANMSAHELAHVSHMYPDRIFDWRSVPVNVKNCILHDLKE